MLKLTNLAKHFGGVRAVDGLDMQINKGEIFGLIGPNGSGKSTTVNLICGVFPQSAGTIELDNVDLGRLAPHQRIESGVSRTFQNIRLFGNLTVWQNLWVAWRDAPGHETSWLINWFGSPVDRRLEILKLLEFSGLGDCADKPASSLSFGEQRRLELARAMASKPKLILLDEPAAGMNSEEVADLRKRILTMKKLGMTVLLVEHVMDLVMSVTDRITVLNFGKPIAEGTPLEIQNNEMVQEAYFGSAKNVEAKN